ncbi:hypothetical protein IPJ91_03455 [bacterium]|nr:MAG: hypothetical protein IPJ91_03455 [bacterium]
MFPALSEIQTVIKYAIGAMMTLSIFLSTVQISLRVIQYLVNTDSVKNYSELLRGTLFAPIIRIIVTFFAWLIVSTFAIIVGIKDPANCFDKNTSIVNGKQIKFDFIFPTICN